MACWLHCADELTIEVLAQLDYDAYVMEAGLMISDDRRTSDVQKENKVVPRGSVVLNASLSVDSWMLREALRVLGEGMWRRRDQAVGKQLTDAPQAIMFV